MTVQYQLTIYHPRGGMKVATFKSKLAAVLAYKAAVRQGCTVVCDLI